MKFPVYLDYSATTPIDPRVVEAMLPYLTEKFGNPASRSHQYGWDAEAAVENARAEVAALVNADPKEIVWTSGATEANNLAIKGAANFYQNKGKHLITVKTEHKAVLDTMRELERQGFEVTYLDVLANGIGQRNQLIQILDIRLPFLNAAGGNNAEPAIRVQCLFQPPQLFGDSRNLLANHNTVAAIAGFFFLLGVGRLFAELLHQFFCC